jgi:hypothetical protein
MAAGSGAEACRALNLLNYQNPQSRLKSFRTHKNPWNYFPKSVILKTAILLNEYRLGKIGTLHIFQG